MEKAAMAYPLCHNKHHGLIKCGYGLCTGYFTKHNPEKAKTQIKALELGNGCHAKLVKNPSASLTQATPPAPPSQPAPQYPPSSPPPPTYSIFEDVDEVIAAVAEAMEEEEGEGEEKEEEEEEEVIVGAFPLSDDEETLRAAYPTERM